MREVFGEILEKKINIFELLPFFDILDIADVPTYKCIGLV